MSLKEGKCSNFGNCSIADSGKKVTVSSTVAICSECGKELIISNKVTWKLGDINPKKIFVIGGLIFMLSFTGFGIWKVMEIRSAVRSGKTTIEQLSKLVKWGITVFGLWAMENKPSQTTSNDSKVSKMPLSNNDNKVDEKQPSQDVKRLTEEVSQMKSDSEKKLQELESKSQKEIQTLHAKLNLQQGLNYVRSKDYNNAIREFTIAIEKDNNNAEAYSNRAVAYMQQRKYAEAFNDLKMAIEIKPKDPYIHYNFAALYAIQNQVNLSFQYLDNALSLGFKEFESLKDDPDFRQLRNLPRYKAILGKYGVTSR